MALRGVYKTTGIVDNPVDSVKALVGTFNKDSPTTQAQVLAAPSSVGHWPWWPGQQVWWRVEPELRHLHLISQTTRGGCHQPVTTLFTTNPISSSLLCQPSTKMWCRCAYLPLISRVTFQRVCRRVPSAVNGCCEVKWYLCAPVSCSGLPAPVSADAI